MSVKITTLELYDFKKVRAFQCEPAAVGLTVIGGKSRAGKTSIPDGVAWCLGGDRHKPEKPQRDGATKHPELTVTLDNGMIVTRKGKNGTLTVTDPDKNKHNQTRLNEFVSQWALDAPKFLRLSGKEKAEALLQIIGVGDELKTLDKQHDELYAEREAHGRVTTQKEKYAAELPLHRDTPQEETSLGEIVAKIQAIDKTNSENEEKRRNLSVLTGGITIQAERNVTLWDECKEEESSQEDIIADCEHRLTAAKKELTELRSDHKHHIAVAERKIAALKVDHSLQKDIVSELTDQPTDALQDQLDKCEETNALIRANTEKKSATVEAAGLRTEYVALTDKIEKTRAARIALLDNADLPLPGLGISAGELTYESMPWDGMATSDQMKVAAAIAAKERPECGFILLDQTETMDRETFEDFGKWAESEDLQVICTRVSTGDECTLIIEDGEVVQAEA